MVILVTGCASTWMIFTIEPMINAGRAETKILSDGWTAVTRDKSLSAQFEHSIGITEGDPDQCNNVVSRGPDPPTLFLLKSKALLLAN